MKTYLQPGWWPALLAGTIIAVCVALPGRSVQAADPDLRELRQQAASLEKKAQELRADGQPDRAEAVMRQVEEIRAQAAKLRRADGPDQPEQPRQRDARRPLPEGQDRSDRFEQPPMAGMMPPRPGLQGRGFQGGPPGPPEMQRQRHLAIAIEHLRAAGLREVAERLAQQVGPTQPGFRGAGPGPRMRGQPDGDPQAIRAEVQELRQAVRELRARVEELSRERK